MRGALSDRVHSLVSFAPSRRAIIRKRRFYPTGFLFRYRARSRTSSTKRRPEEQSCVTSLGCACLSSVSLLWPGRFQFETRSLSARCSALRLRPNNWQGAAQICPRKGTLHKSGTPGRATSSTLERFCLCSFFFATLLEKPLSELLFALAVCPGTVLFFQ